jgi:hypothetical protein
MVTSKPLCRPNDIPRIISPWRPTRNISTRYINSSPTWTPGICPIVDARAINNSCQSC